MKYTRLSTEDASKFYSIHSERPFFGDLISYITSGPIVAAVLKKENAVEDFRSQGVNVVIGPLDNKDFNEVKKFNESDS